MTLLLLSVFWWIDTIIKYTWPIILFGDFYLRHFMPHSVRMRRGKMYLWEMRTFGGPLGVLTYTFALLFTLIVLVLIFDHRWPVDLWWIYIAVSAIVDYITGGDEPGKRVKEWASSKVKKLKIQAPPKPVIDLS